MYTLKEYITEWEKNGDLSLNKFWLMFGTFLDSFYLKKDINMIKDNPFSTNKISKELKAFIVASVEYLYNLVDEEAPDWVYDKQYKLKEPYFPSNMKGEIRAVMCIESPIEFKSRNIFVLGNVLSRCQEEPP